MCIEVHKNVLCLFRSSRSGEIEFEILDQIQSCEITLFFRVKISNF